MGRGCAPYEAWRSPYEAWRSPMADPAGDVREIRARTSRDLELGVGWNS